MSECTCHKNYTLDTLIPKVGVITDIRQETPDVKTFRVEAPEGGKLFEHMPGQCAMICVPGVSEGMFSITSSPTVKEYQEFSIKKCGKLTDYLHSLNVGDEITVRGPYGNHFPVETELKGQNLLFIAGGIGLAPLRSVINYVLHNRENYGTVDILYGSRSADDLVQLKEIQEVWQKAPGVNVYLTIDREQEGWDGHVGFVPSYLKEIGFLHRQDRTSLRTANHDQIRAGRFKRDGLLRGAGIHHTGAPYEMRYRKMRPLQCRLQICLQRWPRIPFRSAGRASE